MLVYFCFMKKDVIAYLCVSNSWGGLEMNQLRNAVWMKERGHEVVLLGLKDSRIIKEAADAGIEIDYVNQHKKYYDFKRAFSLLKLIQKRSVTHLVLRDPKDISLGVTTKRLLKNGLYLAYFMEMQLGVKKNDLIHTWRFKGLDLWSCPLNFLAKQVKDLTSFPESKTKVIPSAMDLSKFENLPSRDVAREKLNLPKDQILLGLIGRLDPFKGHKLLMDAYEMLPSDLKTKISLVFLGEKMNPDIDNFYDRLMERIKEDTFKSSVHILPFRKDVETFYAAIDVFVMASKAETFGMVTIESLASGTPVIGSNAGGTPELLGHGDRGILFETMNKQSLKVAIEHFVNDYQADPNELKSSVLCYGNNEVCELVEKHLNLTN
jgi:glycosyltransferase involved in cell wall biosynthesis